MISNLRQLPGPRGRAAPAVALTLLAACGALAPDGPIPATPPPNSMRTCAADTDCAVYQAGCCDHCNGGTVFSVNQASLAAAQRDHVATCPAELACTLMGCANRVPVCAKQADGSSLCDHIADPSSGPPCSALAEAACASRPDCAAMTYTTPLESCGNVADPTPQFGGCVAGGPRTCTAAETCAVQEASGTKGVFPSGCLPAGWQAADTSVCCP